MSQVAEGRCVALRGLRKEFGGGKVAVASLDLEAFDGQITVLLGHNGAPSPSLRHCVSLCA
jgi:ABC-type multidrug transport system ATPase subunit